jgi:NADPH:quinone reductase-like Zn-dependent oxidoreductase
LQVDYKLGSLPIVGWLLRGKGVGLDFSGVVERVGAAAGAFAPGDRVYGNCSGSLAQFAVADASAIAKLPAGISHAHAASLPTVALTGLQSLLDNGFREGDRVLVAGASGGTGAVGVQLAKCLGASHVTGICSAANAALVTSLGADAVADYTHGDAALYDELAKGAPYDICYDTVTSPEDQAYEPLARRVLKRGGCHVAINGGGADWTRALLSKALGFNLQRAHYSLVLKRPDAAQLAQVAQWVEQGKLKPLVDTTYQFEEAQVHAAFDKLKSRRTKGKLVVTMV